MRWLVLKWYGIGMRWNSQLWFENDGWVWIYRANERGETIKSWYNMKMYMHVNSFYLLSMIGPCQCVILWDL